jgi:hypothetical protein
MFPGGSSILGRSDETRHRPESNSKLRVTAATAAALSEGRAGMLRRHPMYKGADDGCLGRTLNSWMMRKSIRFCQYRIEQNRLLATLADFAASART